MQRDELIEQLYEIGAVKFGTYKLKSGITSPIYIDLRLIVSYPELLKACADLMWDKIKEITFDNICGVPYTALPIATAISLKQNVPMIMRRKEVKDYGTKKAVEGNYKKGDLCMIIEDLVTSGLSVFETVDCLKHEGLQIKDVVVLIDREQGGAQNLEDKELNLHALFTLSDMLDTLKSKQKIDFETVAAVQDFIEKNQTVKMV